LSGAETCHNRRRAAADCLAQGLQEYFVTGQHHELDDLVRKAEPRGVQPATLVVGS